jgi:hypothetical protein
MEPNLKNYKEKEKENKAMCAFRVFLVISSLIYFWFGRATVTSSPGHETEASVATLKRAKD